MSHLPDVAADRRAAIEHVFRRALDGLLAGEGAPWVDMFTDDGVFEFPFAPPGLPTRLEGKAAIAEHMRHLPAVIRFDRFPSVRFLHDDAAEVLVVEFTGEGRMVTTDRPYHQTYVTVAQLRGDRIAAYRDYWNPLVVLDSMGGADAAVQTFQPQAA